MRARGHRIMLRDKLVAYFAANPDDELTIQDIVVKFEVSAETARPAVASMRKVDLLAARGSQGVPIVLTIGPALAGIIGRRA